MLIFIILGGLVLEYTLTAFIKTGAIPVRLTYHLQAKGSKVLVCEQILDFAMKQLRNHQARKNSTMRRAISTLVSSSKYRLGNPLICSGILLKFSGSS
jgi:hypothetical protein